jgi:peroxiredoxin
LNAARLGAVAIFALAAVGGACLAWRAPSAPTQAPDIGYTLLGGRQTTLAQLRGQVVLVNFWATDCAPCVHEMPQLVATQQKYHARGFDTLAVSMRYDPPAYVIRYAEAHRLPFGVAIDNTGAIARSFGPVEVTPSSVLINRRGEIVKRYVGEIDFAALHRLVDQLLAEG